MRKTGYFYSKSFLGHDTGPNHPECPERLVAINKALESAGIAGRLEHIDPPEAEDSMILRNHARELLDRVSDGCLAGKIVQVDADTSVSPGSCDAARKAAGAAVEAARMVLAGKLDNAFCAVRPPGHHAEMDRSMGFCLFNNVAIAARDIIANNPGKKVFIIDWDVHHGNGTQNSFFGDPSVFYASTHQEWIYPGTGFAVEIGAGTGIGCNLNFPMQAGSGEMEFYRVFDDTICPAILKFRPDIILISAGFDAHREDPIGGLALESESFGTLTRKIMTAADEVCNGRIVSMLEGGYNLEALGESAAAHIRTLLDQ